MECSKDKLYFLVETLRRCNKNATDIHAIMSESWPDECLSVRRIRTLCQEFREGDRNSFERERGSGRRNSELRNESVDRVEQMIEEYPNATLRQIADNLDLTHTMVQRILSDDLEKMWLHTKWVPHTITERNKIVRVERCRDLLESMASRLTKSNMVTIDEKFFYCRKLQPRNKIGSWIGPYGDVRQTARRSAMEQKYLAIIAVSQKGHHYFELLARNESVNADRYIQFLVNLETFLRNQQDPILPENLRLQQDNARPHTAGITVDHIEGRNIRLLRQPPYSPDVNLCDRYLFPRLEAIRDNFNSIEEIREFLNNELPNFTKQRMARALQNCMDHMQQIIDKEGAYI